VTLLLLLVACAPRPGDYLVFSEDWSTTCTVGSGPFHEPEPMYDIDVVVSDDRAWLDDNECRLSGMDYACDFTPEVDPLDDAGLDATLTLARAWTGAWSAPEELHGQVDWFYTCDGDDCVDLYARGVELCSARWTYSGVRVEWE